MNNIQNKIISHIQNTNRSNKPFLVAIDGRCASGKTTLAVSLQEQIKSNVFHMDDFFLRPFQRTEQRMEEAGGNVDYERFEAEVLKPLQTGENFSFCPFDCQTQEFKKEQLVEACGINIIEGAYSCHPHLWDYYDLHIFLTIDTANQRKRILKRNGKQKLSVFEEKWIPLEEKYFLTFQTEEKCEMCFRMGNENNK